MGLVLHLFTVSVCLWGLGGILALAFQCERPNPWDMTPGRCYNQVKVNLNWKQ